MKKIDNIGEIALLPKRVDWKITNIFKRPEIENDAIIRSPLFHYAGGDRYFTAQLKLEEGSVIFRGLSVTCCGRDRRDVYCFVFGVFGDHGAKTLLMTSPDVHGGNFSTAFKENNLIIKSNGDIHFFCRALAAHEIEMSDEISVLPTKNKKFVYKEVSTQTDLENGLVREEDTTTVASAWWGKRFYEAAVQFVVQRYH